MYHALTIVRLTAFASFQPFALQQGFSMNILKATFLICVISISLPGYSETMPHSSKEPQGKPTFEGQIAPVLKGMGEHNVEISSKNPLAQTFFNQAIALTYGFNHLEAERSYQQVALLDPQSAIAYWGQALVVGPNINGAMDPSSVEPAMTALKKAIQLKPHASAKEQDLIDALAARYSNDTTLKDRAELDEAYAFAMRALEKKYPKDPLVKTLLAEALMVIHAWDYWYSDGRPKEWTPEILHVLETGLQDHPSHAGLIHYYIHATEASKRPERAERYADTLGSLVPGAGHLVHMPSHIYIRVGRYQDGVVANENAIKVDNAYISQCRAQGVYPVAYVPHNRHFLWALATLQGNSKKAIQAAEHMASHIDTELMREPGLGTLQHYWATPLYAYTRFGKWEKILAHAKPDTDLLYPIGVWHYARGIAFTASGNTDAARKELNALNTLKTNPELKQITVWDINDAQSVLPIAALVLEGEIEGKAGHFKLAINAFNNAIELESALNYDEPSDWHYPVRQSLGAVLLQAGSYQAAEQAYKEDLITFPNNGWSLYGLHQALIKQNKIKEAKAIKQQFLKSWQWADIELKESRVL